MTNVLIVGAGPIGFDACASGEGCGCKTRDCQRAECIPQTESAGFAARILYWIRIQMILAAVVAQETGGIGMDIIIMAIGVPALVTPTLKLARKGGCGEPVRRICQGVMADLDPNVIHYNELKVTGSSAYKRQDYLDASEMVINGYLDLKPIVTIHIKLMISRRLMR